MRRDRGCLTTIEHKGDASWDASLFRLGFLLLTRHPERALTQSNHIIALCPPGSSQEPGHLLSDETYRGDGLDAAFKQALSEHAGEGIHTIYASMNGENYWAKEFGVAYLRNKPLPRATVVFPRISKRCVRELNVSCDRKKYLHGIRRGQWHQARGALCGCLGQGAEKWATRKYQKDNSAGWPIRSTTK